MYLQKIFALFFISIFSFSMIGCGQGDTPDISQTEETTEENAESTDLITEQPEDDMTEKFSENSSVFNNEAAGYDIAYVDGININDEDSNNIKFNRDDINLTVATLDNPSEYDLITYISMNESFPFHYELSNFKGRSETGKKLVFTGKGSDALSPVYYYAKNHKVYKITAANDEAEVLEYIASTLKLK